MAGSLIKISETTVSSGQSAVTITGLSSTYDVYMLDVVNLECATDTQELHLRVTTGGTPDSDSEYDYAMLELKSYAAYGDSHYDDQANWFLSVIGTPAQEQFNGRLFLYNFSNSSKHSFATWETVATNSVSKCSGGQGGGVHSVNEANDGVSFYMASGNIDSGTFKLYGLNK